MKQITIEGNFRIKGDIPALHLVQQPLCKAIIEIEEPPIVRLKEFSSKKR